MALVKRGLFKTTVLSGKIWGGDLFKHFYAVVLEMNIAIQLLASITTDFAPATNSENICLIWLCNKHSAFHFISLSTVLFLRRPYVHKWSIFNMFWVFCKICNVGPYYAFSIQAVQILNTRKLCPLLKFDITYRSPSTVSRKSFLFPGIVEFLQRSSLPPQLQESRLCLSCCPVQSSYSQTKSVEYCAQRRNLNIVEVIGTADYFKWKCRLLRDFSMKNKIYWH
jgi:hypothetical protein